MTCLTACLLASVTSRVFWKSRSARAGGSIGLPCESAAASVGAMYGVGAMAKQGGKKRAHELHDHASRFPRRDYEREVLHLQAELVKLKEWVRVREQRVLVLFEGRDAAGKGGAIKRITEYLNPRPARVVALPAPTERER